MAGIKRKEYLQYLAETREYNGQVFMDVIANELVKEGGRR